MKQWRLGALALLAAGVSASAWGVEESIAGFDVRLTTRLSSGVAIRTQDRAHELIDKMAVPGQQNLCAEDNCQSSSGDPAPNQRLVDAPGGFGLLNSDDGNLNYDKGDVTAATTLIAPEMTVSRGSVSFTAAGMLFYDPVNADFDEHHPDARFQPARTPRDERIVQRYALGGELREAYLRAYVPMFNREVQFSVGRQTVPWGEANLLLFNSINELNPLDGSVASFPGFQIADVNIPAPLALVQFPIGDFVSTELIYQYGWESVRPAPAGSFLSTSDVAGGDQDYIMIGLGNTNDDPERLFRAAGLTGEISQSTRTVDRLPDNEPDDGGQFGLRVSYYADWLNNGTELAFHFLNYHSRLPYLTTFGAQESCARGTQNGTFAEVLVACEGFGRVPGSNANDLLPVDTMKAQLEYPEDIRMFGLSFNTNAGDWALAGELSYRPNLPLQLHQADLVFAALQPAFPEQDIVIGAGAIPGVPTVDGADSTIPGARSAVPDYAAQNRGIDVQPGTRIQGYERHGVAQMSMTALRILSANPFGSDQLLLLLEAGLMHVRDLAGPQTLPLQGPGDYTHPSPGADGTGTPDGEPDTRRQNPTQQRDHFVTPTSWGWRGLVRLTYNEVFPGVALKPTLIWFHDVRGNAPSPMTNFVEGRKLIIGNLDATFGAAWTAGVSYNWYTGAGNSNLERDRDHVKAFIAYEF